MNFSSNLRFLRKRSGKTQQELSADLGIGRTTVANYEAGISEPSLEILMSIIGYFGTSADSLLAKNLQKDGAGNREFSDKKYRIGMPQVITVEPSGDENILFVPVKARAGYLNGYADKEYIESLPAFRLPGLNNATYRMFEVEGPSMSPNLLSGDRVIAEWVENLESVMDNQVYVIVHSEGVAVKRVINKLSEKGKLYLKSDTVAHRHEFPTIEIDPEDIREVWYGRLKISSDFSEPAEVFHRIADLESDMQEMKNHFRSK